MNSWQLHYPDSFSGQRVVGLLREDTNFMQVYRAYEKVDFAFTDSHIHALKQSLLYHALLTVAICESDIENFLIACRRFLLFAFTQQELKAIDNEIASFVSAIAIQCHMNGYLYRSSHEEDDVIHHCLQGLSAAVNPNLLLIVSCYQPIETLPIDRATLVHLACKCPALEALIQQQITQAEGERKQYSRLQSQSIASQHTVAVHDHYESHPYPVFQSSDSYHLACHSTFIGAKREAVEHVLIAGCGSGLSALLNAKYFNKAQVDAFDISLRSLSSAQNKAEQEDLQGINFFQQDLLDFNSDKQYHYIECVGVLQHLVEPELAIGKLNDVLASNGFMRLSCYSLQGRQWLDDAKAQISGEDNIVDAREALKSLPRSHPARRVLMINDLYTRSEFHDMFNHVYERAAEITDIEQWTKRFDFRFLGFEIPDILQQQRFRQQFSSADAQTDFACWIEFEHNYPETFINQYTFWLQKK